MDNVQCLELDLQYLAPIFFLLAVYIVLRECIFFVFFMCGYRVFILCVLIYKKKERNKIKKRKHKIHKLKKKLNYIQIKMNKKNYPQNKRKPNQFQTKLNGKKWGRKM